MSISSADVPKRGGPSNRPAPPQDRETATTKVDRARDFAGRFGLLICLAVAVVGFSIALPDTFARQENFTAIVNSQALILLLALVATIVLRTGDFDLSIAAMMVFSAAMASTLIRDGWAFPLVVLAAIGVGLLIGLINGTLVVRVGVSSFVATLGMMTALGALTYAVTKSQVIFGLDGFAVDLAREKVLGLPLLTWFGWLLALIGWYVYEYTPLGRYLLFVGGSPESARLAGLSVNRIRIGAFVASSVLASLFGILLAGYLGGIDPSVGPSYLLPPFVGAFLGATTIAVGRFNALGTVVALYLLAVVITGLQLLGAASWTTELFNGIALVVAVTLARLVSREES
jgi:ribose transport system permease protein